MKLEVIREEKKQMNSRKKRLVLKNTNVTVWNCTREVIAEGKIIGSEVLYFIPPDMISEDQVCVELFYFGIFDEEDREIEEWWKWLYNLESFPERNVLGVEYFISLKPENSQYEEFHFTMKFVAEV